MKKVVGLAALALATLALVPAIAFASTSSTATLTAGSASEQPEVVTQASSAKTMYVVDKVVLKYYYNNNKNFSWKYTLKNTYSDDGLLTKAKLSFKNPSYDVSSVETLTCTYDSGDLIKLVYKGDGLVKTEKRTVQDGKATSATVTYGEGADDERLIDFTYDAAGKLSKVKVNRRYVMFSEEFNDKALYSYAYNDKGQVVKRIKKRHRSTDEGYVDDKGVQKFAYDSKGNILLDSAKNTYDKNGRLTKVKQVINRDGILKSVYTFTYKKATVPASRYAAAKAQQRAMVNWNLNCTLGTPDLLDGSGFDEIWNNKTYEYKDS